MEQPSLDVNKLVFIDEFGINLEMTRTHARSPIGERATGSAPGRSQGNITLLFGLKDGRPDPVIAPMLIFGSVHSGVFTAAGPR